MKFVQKQPSFSMRTDGRTDLMMQIVAFRSFLKAHKVVPRPPLPHFHSSCVGGFIASDNPTLFRLKSNVCY